MRITHDFHIHTGLSTCVKNKELATPEKYLENAKKYGLTQLGFSDHFWDDAIPGAISWYQPQNLNHVLQLKDELENIKGNGVEIYFGCEAEYDPYHHGVALAEAHAELFDFILVPNSHTHKMMPKELYEPYQKHADFMVQAYQEILDSPVSRYITAIAHPFDAVACPYDYGILLDLISDDQFKRLFAQTAEKGIAVEINLDRMSRLAYEQIERLPELRLFFLAKEQGCKFLFGSDSHSNKAHENYYKAEFIADLLGLCERDLHAITHL